MKYDYFILFIRLKKLKYDYFVDSFRSDNKKKQKNTMDSNKYNFTHLDYLATCCHFLHMKREHATLTKTINKPEKILKKQKLVVEIISQFVDPIKTIPQFVDTMETMETMETMKTMDTTEIFYKFPKDGTILKKVLFGHTTITKNRHMVDKVVGLFLSSDNDGLEIFINNNNLLVHINNRNYINNNFYRKDLTKGTYADFSNYMNHIDFRSYNKKIKVNNEIIETFIRDEVSTKFITFRTPISDKKLEQLLVY